MTRQQCEWETSMGDGCASKLRPSAATRRTVAVAFAFCCSWCFVLAAGCTDELVGLAFVPSLSVYVRGMIVDESTSYVPLGSSDGDIRITLCKNDDEMVFNVLDAVWRTPPPQQSMLFVDDRSGVVDPTFPRTVDGDDVCWSVVVRPTDGQWPGDLKPQILEISTDVLGQESLLFVFWLDT